jgi:hypothetical protein
MRMRVVPPPSLLLIGGPFAGDRRAFHGMATEIAGEVYTVRKLTEYRNDGDRVEKRIAYLAIHSSIQHDKFRAARAEYAMLLADDDWTAWQRIPGAKVGGSR